MAHAARGLMMDDNETERGQVCMAEDNRNKPLYMIGVAAELTGMPRRLCASTSQGPAVNPQRSGGNTRLYSRADIERLELINQLTDEGINLAGVVRIPRYEGACRGARARERKAPAPACASSRTRLHEYKMQKKMTAWPRDGSVNP